MRLSDREWKEFIIKDIFHIYNGKGITREEINDNAGDFVAVQSAEAQNGCLGYIDVEYCKYKNYTMTEEKCLTVARTGSVGFVSYQRNGCVVGDSAKILLLQNTNFRKEEVYLFLRSILIRLKEHYNFARKVTEEIYGDDIIRLPVNDDGEPDYQFMEDYIKSLDVDVSDVPDYFKNDGYDKACWYLDNIDVANFEQEYAGVQQRASIKLSDREWREFKVGGDDGLFECSLPNYDLKVSEVYPGEVNLITTTKDNNGCGDYVADGSCDTVAFEGNKITVNMFGYAFYQEDNFYTVGHGHVNILTPKFEMSKYSGLFVCNMVNNDLYRFSFGRAVYSGVIEDLNINLPVDNAGNPDWQFMEDYIKSLPFSAKL